MRKRRPARHRKQQLHLLARQLAAARADAAQLRLQLVQWQAFSMECIQNAMTTIDTMEKEAQVMWLTIPYYGRWGVMND